VLGWYSHNSLQEAESKGMKVVYLQYLTNYKRRLSGGVVEGLLSPSCACRDGERVTGCERKAGWKRGFRLRRFDEYAEPTR
jgi:hypothetical protein